MRNLFFLSFVFIVVTLSAKKQILPDFQADPTERVFGNSMWIYTSHDIAGSKGWDMVDCDPWDINCTGDWDKYKKAGNPVNAKVRGGHGDTFGFDRHLGHISSFYLSGRQFSLCSLGKCCK